MKHPLDQYEKFPRCWWHIVIGAGLPWLPWYFMLAGIAWFIAYQNLQYKYKTNHRLSEKDDSFLDVFETGCAFGISVIVIVILRGVL